MQLRAGRILAAGLLVAPLMSSNALGDDTRTEWYGSFTGLHNVPSDSEAELGTRLGTIAGDIELSDGTAFAIAVGFETEGGQQVELEVAYRSSDIEGASNARLGAMAIPSVAYTLTGDVDTWSLMVNARHLFDVGPVRPYIGGGLGFARHDGTAALAIQPIPPLVPVPFGGEESGDDTVLAFQLMAGVELDLTENTLLFGGYRYMGTADLEIERLTASYSVQAIEAGIRIRF